METQDAYTESLLDITGQRSGIVIYENSVLVVDWSHDCSDGGLPIIAPFNQIIAWSAGTPIIVTNKYSVDDIRKVLPGTITCVDVDDDGNHIIDTTEMQISYDYYGDIFALWGYDIGLGAFIEKDNDGNIIPTPGVVYNVEQDGTNAVVIAPANWE